MPLFGPPNVSRLAARKDLDGLIKALQYQKDAAIPAASASALGELGDPRAVGPLLAMLHDKRSPAAVAAIVGALGKIRDPRAVEALGELGDPRSVEPLIGALHDGSASVRRAAAKALGRIGDPRSVDPLIDALASRSPLTGYHLRSEVADMLIRIGTPAVAPLIAALGSPTRDRRRAAADTLDRMGWTPDGQEAGAAYWAAKGQWAKCAQIGPPAVAPLVRVLPYVGPQAAGALLAIGAPAVEPLIAALTGPAEKTRERAAAALGDIGDPRAVEPLIVALGNPGNHASARSAAAEALGKLRDERAVQPLITALRGTRPPRVRSAAAKALGKIGDPRAVEPLLAAHHEVGDLALDALAQIGPCAVEPLAAALHDSQAATRLCAVRALENIGGPRTVEALTAALHDESTAVRKVAVRALGQVGDPRAVAPLVAALDDDDYAVSSVAEEIWQASGVRSQRAAEGLEALGDAAVQPLIAALSGKHWQTRRASAEALGQFGGAGVVEALIAALTDEELQVRQAAAAALGRMGDARAVEPLIAAFQNDARMGRVTEKALGALGQQSVPPMHPVHYEWIDEADCNQHVVQFACPICGGRLTVRAVMMFDEDLACDVCGKPVTVPPVPCVRDWCDGVYEMCGGDIEKIYVSEPVGWESYRTAIEFRCAKCGRAQDLIGKRCAAIRCNKCTADLWSTDLDSLQPLTPSDLHWARHRPQPQPAGGS